MGWSIKQEDLSDVPACIAFVKGELMYKLGVGS